MQNPVENSMDDDLEESDGRPDAFIDAPIFVDELIDTGMVASTKLLEDYTANSREQPFNCFHPQERHDARKPIIQARRYRCSTYEELVSNFSESQRYPPLPSDWNQRNRVEID
jgi:hypothetical protein